MNMDPGVTPYQGRLVFHQERLFRSAGGNGCKAHVLYLGLCRERMLPERIGEMSREQVVAALQLIEISCRAVGMHHFRDVHTGWETLAPVVAVEPEVRRERVAA
jgi:hypothetical protein